MTDAVTITAAGPDREARDIALSLIDVPAGRRELDPDWVEALGEEFRQVGQRTPIDVLDCDGRFQLLAGGHRFAAMALIGHETIRAQIWREGDFAHQAQIRLVEIAENMMRRELSVLDRAFDVAAWRDVFEAVQGAVKRGGDRRSKSKLQVATLIGDEELDDISRKFATNFTLAAQRALKLSRDGVFRALKIARLGEVNRRRISLLPIADNQSELLALVAEPSARQALIIERLLDGATSVADAIAIIDDLAPALPLAPWEKMSERFSRLPPAAQHQFFSLHEEAIRAWIAERKG